MKDLGEWLISSKLLTFINCADSIIMNKLLLSPTWSNMSQSEEVLLFCVLTSNFIGWTKILFEKYLWAFLKISISSSFLINSSWKLFGIASPSFLVIQGCFNALAARYLRAWLKSHALLKKSHAILLIPVIRQQFLTYSQTLVGCQRYSGWPCFEIKICTRLESFL